MWPGSFVAKASSPGAAHCAIFRHEDGATTSDTLDHAEKTSATSELRMGGHLDRTAHPGEFSGFGDDGLVILEDEFEDGHRGSGDAALHEVS